MSYAFDNWTKIAPIVQTVRTIKKDLEFQDNVHIIPSERWRERVLKEIQQAKMVIVF
jgi:hypothetical protein